MKVSLVSLTQSKLKNVTLSPEELIVYTARVSNPGNQLKTESTPKLLSYLIKQKHWSPFQMVDMTVEVETSLAISLQMLRHWSMVLLEHEPLDVQQFSQRYAIVNSPIELCSARRQDIKNRQNSIDDLADETKTWFDVEQIRLNAQAQQAYKHALDAGIAKEQARMLLPISTKTTFYLKGSVRSYIHYLIARTAPDTQQEHRDVAEAIYSIFADNFPLISACILEVNK